MLAPPKSYLNFGQDCEKTMSNCSLCGTPSTYIKGVRKLRDQIKKLKSGKKNQNLLVDSLRKEMTALKKQNTAQANKLHRLTNKYNKLKEDAAIAEKKSAAAQRSQNQLKKKDMVADRILNE